MPHLYCLRGDPGVLWLQVISDLAIAVAYYAIPFVLLRVVLKRKEALFRRLAVLFVLFIAACGTTHVLEVWTIWHPMYRLEGVVKALTAVLSVVTALVLVRLRPQIMQLPSLAEIEKEIVERREAERAARANEERLRLFGESVEDYAIYMLDVNGMVQTWNKGAQLIKGYAAAEIVGKHFSRFYTAEDRAKKLPEAALRTAVDEGGHESVGWRVRKDGSRFWAKVVLRPMRDHSGALLGFSKVTRDLSESQEMESKYRMLLEAAPDAIFIISRSGRIEFVNGEGEKLFGYTRAEILGKPVDILNPVAVREEQAKFREQIFGDLKRIEVNADAGLLAVRKDGSEFPIEFTLSPLETKDGWVFLIALRDVSEKQRTDARFRALLESAPDPMVIVNVEGLIELVNLQTEKLFGYTRMELVGQSVDMLVPLELRGAHASHRDQFFRSPKPRSMGAGLDLMASRKDGSQFPVEISLSPLEGQDGISVTAAIRDVTDRKKAETRFRALLESAPDAMVISDAVGRIELVNAQAERLFGYERTEMVGQPVQILIPSDLRSDYGRDSVEFLHGGIQREVGPEVDLRARRKDGSEFPVEISFSPLEGPNGISLTAAIRDITDRKKAETRFRALLESAPDAMVIVNAKGCVEIANLQTERLFGYTRGELIGQSVDILVPSSLRGAHGGHRDDFFAAPKQREMGAGLDLMAARKDGTEFPVEISLSPLEGPDGISVTAAIRDTTERRQAGQQLAAKMVELRHSNEALEQFAHIASHDLQEPLRMVASYTQLLSKRYKGRLDADADEFISYAVDGTQRMKRLIEDLLLYSRAGKGAPPLAEFSVEEALQEAMNNLSIAIRDSNAAIIHDALPRIVGVESGTVQVLQNLIGNAIKYRGDRTPRIHVSAAKKGQEWVVSVADNGIGIDPKYFERIFVIFQRLHGREEYQGTGIGLAICKRILQQQGGRIWVESEPDKGSVFYFSLPQR